LFNASRKLDAGLCCHVKRSKIFFYIIAKINFMSLVFLQETFLKPKKTGTSLKNSEKHLHSKNPSWKPSDLPRHFQWSYRCSRAISLDWGWNDPRLAWSSTHAHTSPSRPTLASTVLEKKKLYVQRQVTYLSHIHGNQQKQQKDNSYSKF